MKYSLLTEADVRSEIEPAQVKQRIIAQGCTCHVTGFSRKSKIGPRTCFVPSALPTPLRRAMPSLARTLWHTPVTRGTFSRFSTSR